MKFSKICNTVATVVGYATLAVAAYTVIDALRVTIEDEMARKRCDASIPTFNKETTMSEWMNQNGGDFTSV